MYWFYYKRLGVGGAETLVFRLANYMSSIYGAGIISDVIDKSYENKFKKNVKIETSKAKRISLLQGMTRNDILMTFYLRDYLKLKLLKGIFNYKYRLVLYILHPMLLDVRSLDRFPLLQSLVIGQLRREVINAYSGHRLIFHTENAIKYIGNKYKCKALFKKESIFRIPYEIAEVNNNLIDNKSEKFLREINILAVARADFPFKGYIKGLIEDYEKLKIDYPLIKLTIISSGKDYEELLNEVQKKADNTIKIINGVPYEELSKYYKKAHIFVGMGSTIIEAAQYMSIPIIAKSYTNEFITTYEPFYDTPEILGGFELQNCMDGIERLREILDYSKEEYISVAIKCREAVEKIYDIRIIAKEMNLYLKDG